MQKTTLHDTVYVASITRPNPYRQKLDEWYLGVRGTVKVEREGLLMGASSLPLAGEAGKGRYFILFYLFVDLLAMPCNMWDLGPPTRDRSLAPCSGGTGSTES